MGYTTIFEGNFELDKHLDDEIFNLLKGLSETRRMKRNPEILEQLGYGNAELFGVDGEFFVGKDFEYFCPSIINQNIPPGKQPGLWLQWVPNDDRRSIIWDGAEKFYHADKWIVYLIERVLEPRGYVLNGVVNAQGEDDDDQWHIQIADNHVLVVDGFNGLAPLPDYGKWIKEYYK
jgi:hypothetical protein